MTCGTCGAALDLRASLVRVVGSRVVVYCSTSCLAGIAPEPAVESTPAPAAAPEPTSAPAIEPPVAIETVTETALPIPADPPSEIPAAAMPRRWPLAWRVAINLGGVTVAVALMGLLWQTVPSQPDTAAALPQPESQPVDPPEQPLAERARAVLDGYLVVEDAELAFQAADALTRLGDPRGKEVMLHALAQPGNPRRMLAAERLAAAGDAEALALLRARLDSRKLVTSPYRRRTMETSRVRP